MRPPPQHLPGNVLIEKLEAVSSKALACQPRNSLPPSVPSPPANPEPVEEGPCPPLVLGPRPLGFHSCTWRPLSCIIVFPRSVGSLPPLNSPALASLAFAKKIPFVSAPPFLAAFPTEFLERLVCTGISFPQPLQWVPALRVPLHLLWPTSPGP